MAHFLRASYLCCQSAADVITLCIAIWIADVRFATFAVEVFSFTTVSWLCLHALLCETDRLCLTQVDRWRHSVSDVVEYVTAEKVTRIYFQHTSCVHTPVGNPNTLGLYWLITSYF
jgi:hypothetical protein